ncbi:MAG: response regulator [Porcipelethomonas sp.]
MNYKILVTGKAALVRDFLQHSYDYFKSISTSEYLRDITAHFEMFKPDAYVIFADSPGSESTENLNKLKEHYNYNSSPVIIVGNAETCDELKLRNPYLANLFIKRPISADNIALAVTRFLEKLQKEAEKAEAEKAMKIRERQLKKEAEEKANAKKHILIVDDDKSVLKLLKTALADSYDVTTMINGILVEKFLDAKDVDLIILDYEMPIETGAEVFRKLKNHPKGKNTPVCFLTGVAEREKIEEIMLLKPHGYLLKPINMDMLMATIQNLTA